MTPSRQTALALTHAVIAAERRRGTEGEPEGTPPHRVVMAKLHGGLAKSIGSHGFDVLLARALKTAQRTDGLLLHVTAGRGGLLDGLGEATGDQERAFVAVLSQLLEILMRFIGEDLTTRILHDIWPNLDDLKETKT